MKKLQWIGLVLVLLLLVWGGWGFFVFSRNRVPELPLPSPISPPPANIYDEYVECVGRVQSKSELATLERLPQYGSPQQKQEVLARNREVLQAFHRLVGKPCGVTRVEPMLGDPAVDDFRSLAHLVAAEGKLAEQQGQPDRALSIYLEGLTYAEDMMRGGVILHFIRGYLAETTLFQVIPAVIPQVSAQAAESGAQRLEHLLKTQYPLKTLFEQEYRVAVGGWLQSIRHMRMRGFRLDFPSNPGERQFLLLPKENFVKALSQYMQGWIEQASQPYPLHQPVEYPSHVEGMPEAAVSDTATMERCFTRYTYKDTRLRLLYTALRLEAYRKQRGRYPATLGDLGTSPWFTDPFSDKPFVYRGQGNSYVLYSLGPNGKDDGGLHFPEGKFNRNQPGDITLIPTFVLPAMGR